MDIITVTKSVLCGLGQLNLDFPVNFCLNNLCLGTGCKDTISINTFLMQNQKKVGNSYS